MLFRSGVFRLYNRAVPEVVRRARGVIFSEWREAQETSPGRCQELVAVHDGRVQAWLALSQTSNAGMFDLMVDPEAAGATEALVRHALHRLGSRVPVVCLVPEFQGTLQRVVEEDLEARPVAEFTTLVKYLTVRVPARGLVPAHA